MDLTARERDVVARLQIDNVEWCVGKGICARREDVTVVMAVLTLYDPIRWFRVVSSHEEPRP